MTNLMLFALTTLTYFAIWCRLEKSRGLAGYAKKACLTALLCIPFNINGNIWTVLGNAESEKSIYSLCSLYQKAKNEAVTLIGLAGYQSAGQDAVTIFGFSGYQSAGQDARTDIGLAGYQSAGRDAIIIAGLSGYQSAGNYARNLFGLAIYQKAGENSRSLGAFGSLSAE